MVAVTMADFDLGHFDDEESPEAMLILSIEVPEVVPIKVEVTGIFTECEGPVMPVAPMVVRRHKDDLLNEDNFTLPVSVSPLLGTLAGARFTLESICAMC